MCLKERASVIEKACKEINKALTNNRGIKYIHGYKVFKNEAEPIVNKVCNEFGLNSNNMFKILQIE